MRSKKKADSIFRKAYRNVSIMGLCLFAMLIASMFFSCSPAIKPQQVLERITVQLKWLHQAQFSGFYLAKEKGYYSAENLDVSFIEGGQGIDNVLSVTSGQADFGILSPEEILINRGRGYPLTGVAAIFRRGAVVFLSRGESGIKKPPDFRGKTAAVKSSGSFREGEIQFYCLLKKQGLNPSTIKAISWEADYKSFLGGEADITPTYVISGLVRLRQQGLNLNIIRPDDYGIHFYSDILCATGEFIDSKADVTGRFVKASLRGWQDAINDYQSAVEIALRYNGNKEPAVQKAMMEAMLPLVHTGEDRVGWMKPEIWQGMYSMLKEQGLLVNDFDFQEAFKLDFINGAWGARQP